MAEIDITKLVNKGMPKTWTCPHCGKRNRTGPYKEEELIEFGKTLQQCDCCGYVHLWKLELTEDFKHAVVDMLLSEAKNGTCQGGPEARKDLSGGESDAGH